MKAQVVQYKRPNGERIFGHFDRSDEVADKANQLWKEGYEISIELVPGNLVSLCISNREEDLYMKLPPNGPELLEAFDEVVKEAYEHLCC